jgi:hypothetical protein
MIQKFIDKKKSVGYSHPPIIESDGRAWFKAHDGTEDGAGRVLIVSVKEFTLDDELDAATAKSATKPDLVDRAEVLASILKYRLESGPISTVIYDIVKGMPCKT